MIMTVPSLPFAQIRPDHEVGCPGRVGLRGLGGVGCMVGRV